MTIKRVLRIAATRRAVLFNFRFWFRLHLHISLSFHETISPYLLKYNRLKRYTSNRRRHRTTAAQIQRHCILPYCQRRYLFFLCSSRIHCTTYARALALSCHQNVLGESLTLEPCHSTARPAHNRGNAQCDRTRA